MQRPYEAEQSSGVSGHHRTIWNRCCDYSTCAHHCMTAYRYARQQSSPPPHRCTRLDRGCFEGYGVGFASWE